MKTLIRGYLVAAVAFAVACGGGDAPPVPATITFTPATLSFDAVGATSPLTVVVNDNKGRPIDNAVVTWTATGTAVTLTPPATTAVGPGTHAASVTSAAKGQTLVKARTAGNISATLNVTVDQKAVSIVAISGDNQAAAPGHALPQQIAVQLRDRLGVPLTDGSIAFDVVDGGGSVAPATVTLTSDGVGRTTWTLGSTTTEHLSATDGARGLTPVTFTATASATAGLPSSLIATAGGNQALLAGANGVPPAVKVVDAAGNGVAGVGVSFAVIAGGGSINATSATTGADGVASLARWTMGSVGALNAVTATVATLSPLEFDDAGCDNGAATGFAITLCYRSTMTASQRQAFVDAASRWSSIITSDLPDITSDFSGVCGGTVPNFVGNIDDLLNLRGASSTDRRAGQHRRFGRAVCSAQLRLSDGRWLDAVRCRRSPTARDSRTAECRDPP